MGRDAPEIWLLRRGDQVLGRIEITGADQPFLEGTFTAMPAFEAVRELFERELRLLNENRADELEFAMREIDELGLELVQEESGEVVAEFLLHVDGDVAWFRY